MKRNNKGFFARLMALTIIAAVMFTDCTAVKAAEPATGPTLEVIGDLEMVLKRGSIYEEPGCKVVQRGQELPDLTAKVVTKYYEIRQVEGEWTEVLLNPFDTKRIAKVKVRYSCDIVVDGVITTIEAVRDLDIVDDYDPEYDAFFKRQVAAQKAYADAEKLKGTGNGNRASQPSVNHSSNGNSGGGNGGGTGSGTGGGGDRDPGDGGGTGGGSEIPGGGSSGGGGDRGDGGDGGSGGSSSEIG